MESHSQWCHPGQSDCAASHGACSLPQCPPTLPAGAELRLPGHVLPISVVLAASVVSLYSFHLTSSKVLPGWASQQGHESDVGVPYQNFQAPVHLLPTSCRLQAFSIVNWVSE